MKKKNLSMAILSIVLILTMFGAYSIGGVQTTTDINIPVTKLHQSCTSKIQIEEVR